jgi:hypothetical protein
MVAMLGMTALVVDYGRIAREDQKLTKALDAAVLAGVQELPDDPSGAVDYAEQYLSMNGFDMTGVSFSIAADNRGITGEGAKTVNNFFARVLGHDTSQVYHRSTARIDGTSRIGTGVRPFGVVFELNEDGEPEPPNPGDAIVLKVGSDEIDGEEAATTVLGPGNFGALDLDGIQGGGNSEFVDDAVNGYDGIVSIGDEIFTETGNMPNVIKELEKYFKDDDVTYEEARDGAETKRIWIIPVVNTMDISGSSTEVEVLGFAVFYINDIIGKNDSKSALIGRFLDVYRVEGDSDEEAPMTGLVSIALVE